MAFEDVDRLADLGRPYCAFGLRVRDRLLLNLLDLVQPRGWPREELFTLLSYRPLLCDHFMK